MTREEAIDILRCRTDGDAVEALEMAIQALEQESTGHWIIIDDCEKFIAKCSECGQIEDSRMIGKYAYCHCGARMSENPTGSKPEISSYYGLKSYVRERSE